ncbi:MAG: radical SAM protein, partial [Dethiobacteria bacterium]|nr:radical SAM protein [Dethiobacteria bacterium]
YFPHTKRVFLADGNALAIATDKLLEILQQLDKAFPLLERVTLYGNPHDLLEKSITELQQLGQSKLGMIYLGVESGSAKVLEAVKKGVTPDEMAAGAARVKAAAIPLSVTVLNGLAGAEGSVEHAEATARLLNRMDPEYIGLLSLITVPGTTMHRQFKEGKLTPLSPWQLLEEIRMIVAGLELTNSVFRANHASNYLPLKATLPRDKKALLAALDQIIAKKAPGSLKSEFMRGL